MYIVKQKFIGSHLTLPTELRKYGIYTTLLPDTNQKILEFLYKYGHPGVELKEKKNDNSK
jgi:hypothetical protein